MKITLDDRKATATPEGHLVREMLGLETMNVSKYSVAHIVAEAGSRDITRENQFDEILLVIKGHGTVRQDYVDEEIGPKDVVLLPAGTRYAIEAQEEEDLELWAICVPAYRAEWSNAGSAKRDWREYQVPRGAERLRSIQKRNEDREG
ncbi:MAG: hypothetical protein M3220_11955 [Chloroflexota bacterium]|nr:hypothetical protein [Chloroflexota bacterium]